MYTYPVGIHEQFIQGCRFRPNVFDYPILNIGIKHANSLIKSAHFTYETACDTAKTNNSECPTGHPLIWVTTGEIPYAIPHHPVLRTDSARESKV